MDRNADGIKYGFNDTTVISCVGNMYGIQITIDKNVMGAEQLKLYTEIQQHQGNGKLAPFETNNLINGLRR